MEAITDPTRDSSLPAALGPIIPLVDPTLGDANILGSDPTLGANASSQLQLLNKQSTCCPKPALLRAASSVHHGDHQLNSPWFSNQ
ncbi:UNVERIFIED_CONTAM: hypothetical protein Sradi_3025300 [Sesamum radiatum]|uniref:Uncharacterized protein n=1 Tax=Sesamum radiatum TaxID=300843 RepID=A0AAW2S2I1_SESRA